MKLEANALLEDNLRKLETKGLVSTATAAALRAVKNSRLSISKEDGWIYEDAAKGVRCLLQSRRNPEAEAVRQIEAWLNSEAGRLDGFVALLGTGGLCQAKELSRKLAKGSTLMIVEPAPDLLAAALSQVKLADIEKTGVRLLFCSSGEIPAILEEFRLELRKLPRLDVAVFANPGPARTDSELYSRLEAGMAEKLRLEFTNRETLARFSNEWILNSLVNLPASILSAQAGALAGVFEGSSALIIGAGPSLDGALEFIKPLKNSFVVIAAGTALKPLLKAGIEPDFIVGVDSDPKTLKQFEGIPLERTRLACSLNVDPRLPRLFDAGRRVVFSVNLSAHLNAWLEGHKLLPAMLSAGGTVAVSAMDFARLLGCKRLVLCGVDLAMAENGSTHASGSIYEGQKELGLIPVPGNHLERVMTNWQFSNYISMTGNFLCSLHKQWGVETFNVSDTGARIANAQPAGIERLESFLGLSPETGRGKLASLMKPSADSVDGLRKVLSDASAWFDRLSANPSDLEKLIAEKGSPKMLLEALLEAQSHANGGHCVSDGSWLFSIIPPAASQLSASLRKAREELP